MIAQRDEYTSNNSIHEGIYLSANHNAQDEIEELNTEKVPIITNNEGAFYDQALTAKQIRKACRNSGKAYVTSSGKCMPPKKVTPLSECRAKCNTRFTFEMQQTIFNEYWNLGSYDKRAAFVSSMIAVSDKKSIRPRTYEARKEKFRTKTYGYSLVYGGERLPTCKGCFLKTLDESEGMIKTVAHKKRANPTGILCDMRGKSSAKQDGFDVHVIPAKSTLPYSW